MRNAILDLDTSGQTCIDLTSHVRSFCASEISGLCNVFVPHATAGLAIIELGAGSERDLAELIERILPRQNIYSHVHGSVGHGRDHVLPALISPSVTVPVIDGEPAFGTWQYLVLVDTNRDNPQRQVRLSFLTG